MHKHQEQTNTSSLLKSRRSKRTQSPDESCQFFFFLSSVLRDEQKITSIWVQRVRATLDSYSSELVRISLFLLRAMAKNLGLRPDVLVSIFEEGIQGIRLNYYPPCKQANEVLGQTPHSDATGITLLSQVNDVDGLQIKKNGKWLPIKPVPGAFIVNVGDVIEIMSNGQYKSIEHRVVVNPEKERLSIAAFHSPNIEATIGPFPDLAGESEAQYKTTNHEDYMRLVVASRVDGKSLLDQFRLSDV